MGYDMYRVGADNDRRGDGYFRLNMFGMSAACYELESFGVVRYVECPDYPHDGTDEDRERWRTAVPPGDNVGIASYKFNSNDDWLVTPGEIRTSVVWADHHYPGWRERLTDFVREFVEWMEFTIPSGGFTVS